MLAREHRELLKQQVNSTEFVLLVLNLMTKHTTLVNFQVTYSDEEDAMHAQTDSGVLFNYESVGKEMITVHDIAFGLAKQARFNGHLKGFRHYSIAEHCVLGSYKCHLELEFLLHDASEAWTGDINTHLKALLGQPIRVIEERIMKRICEKFDMLWNDMNSQHVKEVDLRMLATEKKYMRHDLHWHGLANVKPYEGMELHFWEPEKAYTMFLERFAELF